VGEFRIFTGAGGKRFVGETGQGELVERISRAAGAPINSNARDQAAAGLLHSIGLHAQAEVIILHARGVPGFGPANPVNRSTHCRFNDGAAYRRFVAGFKLGVRGRGVDTANTPAFLAEAHKQGLAFFLTYPGSVGERQHVNEATSTWGKRLVPQFHAAPGDRGRNVRRLRNVLVVLGLLDKRGSVFGTKVEAAVRVFQLHHHLKVDGVVGPMTWAQLVVAYRQKKKHPPKPPAPHPPHTHPPAQPIPHQLHKGVVNGPDVSEHQGDVDWRKVSVGMNEFAGVRVNDGDHRDSRFSKARLDSMRAQRVIPMPYAYLRVASPGNGERNGAAECDMTLRWAHEAGWGKPGDLQIAADFEEANGQSLRKAGVHLVQWVARYHDRTGAWPTLYSSPAFLAAVMATLSPQARAMLAKCPLWIAHVGPGGKPRTAKPTVPRPWKRYTFWQFSWVGRQPGISTPCDMSIFNGSFSALLRLTIRR
jgi:GH25 family lysozyme M1 (1,4-beta-N-acetylmuramidase)